MNSVDSLLQHRMAEFTQSKGIRGFTADILAENTAMLKLAQKCVKSTAKLVEGAYEVEMLFD